MMVSVYYWGQLKRQIQLGYSTKSAYFYTDVNYNY